MNDFFHAQKPVQRKSKPRALWFLLNGLMLIFAYCGFVVGNDDARFAALVMMWACFGMAFFMVLAVEAFKYVFNRAEGNPEAEAKAVIAAKSLKQAASAINIWRELMVDIPVAALAIFGGAYITAIAYVLHTAAMFYFASFRKIGRGVL